MEAAPFGEPSDFRRAAAICRELAILAADLELKIDDLDRKLGPPPPELAVLSAGQDAN